MNEVLLQRIKEDHQLSNVMSSVYESTDDLAKLSPEVVARLLDFDSLRSNRFDPKDMRLYNVILGSEKWMKTVEHEWTLWHTLMMSHSYYEITHYIRTYFEPLSRRLEIVKETITTGSTNVYNLACDTEWKSFPVETKTIEWVWRLMQSHTRRFCKSSILAMTALLNAVTADAYRNGVVLNLDASASRATIDAFLHYLQRLHVTVDVRGQAGQHLDTIPVIGGDIIPRFVVTEIEVGDPLLGGIERIRLV